MWCLISLNYNEDDADDKSPDLIPNDWIINKFNCWYPLDFKISTINLHSKIEELTIADKDRKLNQKDH